MLFDDDAAKHITVRNKLHTVRSRENYVSASPTTRLTTQYPENILYSLYYIGIYILYFSCIYNRDKHNN